MLFLTSSMIEDFGLPPELSTRFLSGNMSYELRQYYEPVVGAAVKQGFEERPALLQEVLTGADYAEAASRQGMTANEYFFGLGPGYEALFGYYEFPHAVLGMLLLRDEPIAHLRTLREMVEREHLTSSSMWGDIWLCRAASEDWFDLWTKHLFKSENLTTVIRMGMNSDECFRFMVSERYYVAMGLEGVPLRYALDCGPLTHEAIQAIPRTWTDGVPAEYARVLISGDGPSGRV